MTHEEIRWPAASEEFVHRSAILVAVVHPQAVILSAVRRQPNEVEGPHHGVQYRKPIQISWHGPCDTTGGEE